MIDNKVVEVVERKLAPVKCTCDRCGSPIVGKYIRVTTSDTHYMEDMGNVNEYHFCNIWCAMHKIQSWENEYSDLSTVFCRDESWDAKITVETDFFRPPELAC